MKPARRTTGPRPRSRSTARQQGTIWSCITRDQDWTTRAVADETGIPLSTVQQYAAALQRTGYIRRLARGGRGAAGAEPDTWRTSWRARKLAQPPLVTWADRTARPQGTPTPEHDE